MKQVLKEVRLPKSFFKVIRSFTFPGVDDWDVAFNKDEYLYLDSSNKDVLGYVSFSHLWKKKGVKFSYLLSPQGYKEFTQNVIKIDSSQAPELPGVVKKKGPIEFTTTIKSIGRKLDDLDLEPSTKIKVAVLEQHLTKLTGKEIRFVESINISDSDVKLKRGLSIIETEDYIINFDYEGEKATLNWINTKTNKYKGKEIFNAFLDYMKSKGVRKIGAYGTKGNVYGIKAYGYYVMLKWGFIPENISEINDLLSTSYNSFEEALQDSNFWNQWKEKGDDYYGIFDLTPNSLSWKLFNRA